MVRHSHHTAAVVAKNGPAAVAMPPTTASKPDVERPAGTLVETGAATGYDSVINSAATRSTYQVQGSGMAVAVIDTGVDYNNPAFGGGFGPGDKVIAGYDFSDGSANPMATTSQHGTAIAGLIGSDDPSDLGVAPGVNIVALKVTDDTNTASLASVASALQWVVDNHSEYNITAVNVSLSDGGNYAQNWFANDGGEGEQITNLIGQLTAMNIPVIAATGNSFTGQQGEGFAAIAAGTISVTATDLSDNLLPDAQRLGTADGGASATTIAAPGDGFSAPMGDSGTSAVDGTSFAAALVTGSVTLLQDIYQSRFGSLPTVTQLKSWLQQGATPIQDPVTGITIGELNVLNSANLIPQAPGTTPLQPAGSTGSSSSSGAAVSSSNSGSSGQTSTGALTTSTNVTVYVNGQAVNTGSSASNSSSTAIDPATLDLLLTAMTAWQADAASSTVAQGTTQVQIWNASS
jgi:subtilisin family serine protease